MILRNFFTYSKSDIETRIFGLADSISAVLVLGLFSLSRFSLKTFGQTMKSCRNITC